MDLDRLRELGVIRFVPKPFSVDQLRGIIEDQLRQTKPAEKKLARRSKTSQSETKQSRISSISATRSLLGGRWLAKAGVRKQRRRQFWVIAVICAGLSIAVLGAKLIVTETNILFAIKQSLQKQSEMDH